jgi:ribonuclease HI
MKKTRGITINTDASFCPKTGAGAYAFYIVCDLFKIKKSGIFKESPTGPMDAEIKCIANAVATLNAQKELPKIGWVIINSDCLWCFDKITLKSKDKAGRYAAKELQKLRKKTGVAMHEFRHVKAHTDTEDARSFVNNWCDTEAKRLMLIRRAELSVA